MFFDRYEIHIQAFVDVINGKLIIFRSSSPQNCFEDIYSKNRYQNYIQKINSKKVRVYLSKIFENVGCQTWKNNIFPGCSHILSNIF